MKYYAAYAVRKQAMPEDIFDEFNNHAAASMAGLNKLTDDDDCAVFVIIDNEYYKMYRLMDGKLLASPGPYFTLKDARPFPFK